MYQPHSLLMCGQALRRAGLFCSALPKGPVAETQPSPTPWCTTLLSMDLSRSSEKLKGVSRYCIPGVDRSKPDFAHARMVIYKVAKIVQTPSTYSKNQEIDLFVL